MKKKRFIYLLLIFTLILVKPGGAYAKDEDLDFYTSLGARARDFDGNEVSYLDRGAIFQAKREGNYLISYQEERKVRIHKNFADKGIYRFYGAQGAKVYDGAGKVIGRLKWYEELKGNINPDYKDGNYVVVTYKGQKAYLHVDEVTENMKNMGNFFSKGAIVRDLNGKKLGRIKKDQRFDGFPMGDKVYLTYKGQVASVHRNYADLKSRTSHELFYSKGAIMRDKNGVNVGRIPLNRYFYGVREKGKISTLYYDEKIHEEALWVTIHPKFVNQRSEDIKPYLNKADKTFKLSYLDRAGKLLKEETVRIGANAKGFTPPRIKGYEFKGWDQSLKNISRTMTLKPIYEKKSYTVSFVDPSGNIYKQIVVGSGESLKENGIDNLRPSFSGRKVIGWANLPKNGLVEKDLILSPILDEEKIKVKLSIPLDKAGTDYLILEEEVASGTNLYKEYEEKINKILSEKNIEASFDGFLEDGFASVEKDSDYTVRLIFKPTIKFQEIEIENGEKIILEGIIDEEATDRMFERVNEVRKDKGLPSLKRMEGKEEELFIRVLEAQYMVENYGYSYSHDRPSGREIIDIINAKKDLSIHILAENLAFSGYGSGSDLAESMMVSLYNSDGHRRNMLLSGVSQIGVLVVHTPIGAIAVQVII